jgi:hypothetical protein
MECDPSKLVKKSEQEASVRLAIDGLSSPNFIHRGIKDLGGRMVAQK